MSTVILPEEIINKILIQREPHPIANLIKKRFSQWYDGTLTIYELNKIKEKMLKAKKEANDYENKTYDSIWDCKDKIREQKRECNEECKTILNEHLKICKNGCKNNFVSYFCQFEENGRCSHYYEIENINEILEWYEENLSDLYSRYYEIQSNYERNLAIKENRLNDYEEKLDEEWEDMAFQESMRISQLQREGINLF